MIIRDLGFRSSISMAIAAFVIAIIGTIYQDSFTVGMSIGLLMGSFLVDIFYHNLKEYCD